MNGNKHSSKVIWKCVPLPKCMMSVFLHHPVWQSLENRSSAPPDHQPGTQTRCLCCFEVIGDRGQIWGRQNLLASWKEENYSCEEAVQPIHSPEVFPGDFSEFLKPYCWRGRGARSQRRVAPGFCPAVIASCIAASAFSYFQVRIQAAGIAKQLHYSPFSLSICVFVVVSLACHALQAWGEVSQKVLSTRNSYLFWKKKKLYKY